MPVFEKGSRGWGLPVVAALSTGVLLVLLSTVVALGGLDLSAQSDSKEPQPLQSFAPLVGEEWSGSVESATGTTSTAHVRYELGVNQKLIKIQFIMESDGQRMLINEAVIAWHPVKQSLFYTAVAVNGGVSEGTVEVDGSTTTLRYEEFVGEQVLQFRQITTVLDETHYSWQLFMKQGNEWIAATKEAKFSRP